MKFIDTLEKHRKEANKSLASYIKEVRVGLGQEIADRKKVYLDTKYWLLLRDVVLERINNEYLSNLLLLLRQKVHDKYLICPISEDIFIIDFHGN